MQLIFLFFVHFLYYFYKYIAYYLFSLIIHLRYYSNTIKFELTIWKGCDNRQRNCCIQQLQRRGSCGWRLCFLEAESDGEGSEGQLLSGFSWFMIFPWVCPLYFKDWARIPKLLVFVMQLLIQYPPNCYIATDSPVKRE